MDFSPKITLQPVYGTHTAGQALAHLLSVGGLYFLLDAGCDSNFSEVLLSRLLSLPPLNGVLLSHSDLAHSGALPFLQAHRRLPHVYSTLPVWRMAQMSHYDIYQSLTAQREFTMWNLDDVDAAFETTGKEAKFHLLKYQQSFNIKVGEEEEQTVAITPHAAGHTLGGSVWVIALGSDSIVYAPDFNHRKERHLAPTTLGTLKRPSHLILGARNALTKAESKKTSALMDAAMSAMEKGGDVLFPVDTAGRIIELAIAVDDFWRERRENRLVCCVLHEMASQTFEFAKTMIEWMSNEVVTRFDSSRENIFAFKYLKLCNSLAEFRSLPSPKLCLASSPSLEIGLARELFLEYATNPRNLVVLTDYCEPGTLAARLLGISRMERQGSVNIVVSHRRKEFLKGEELRLYREKERREKEAKEDAEKAQEIEDAYMDGDEDVHLTDQNGVDTILSGTLERKVSKSEHGLQPMFPYIAKVKIWDAYGEVVDMKRFTREDAVLLPNEGTDALSAMQADVSNAPLDPALSIPTKYVESKINVSVSCQIQQFECQGLSDGDSTKRLVSALEPLCVVITHGTSEETLHLQSYLEKSLFRSVSKGAEDKQKTGVFCPSDNQTLDVTSNVFVTSVPLHNALMKNLQWHAVNGASLACVDGVLTEDEDLKRIVLTSRDVGRTDVDLSANTPSEIAGGQPDEEIEYVTEAWDSDGESIDERKSGGRGTMYVGTVMLNRLKEIVKAEGLNAEFAGGALCVENAETGAVVLVKKVGPEDLVVEGSMCEEYFRIRDLVYGQMSVL